MPSTIFETPGLGTGGTGTAGSTGNPTTQGRNYNAPGFDNPWLQNAMNALLGQQLAQIYGMAQPQPPPSASIFPPAYQGGGNQVAAQGQQSPSSQAVMQAIKGPPTQQGGGQQQLRK